MDGTVKFYNYTKRFGFISGNDGKDYFFHESGILDKSGIKDNVKVSFDVEPDQKGPKAVKVKVL